MPDRMICVCGPCCAAERLRRHGTAMPPWRLLFEVTSAGKWDLAASQAYDNGVL